MVNKKILDTLLKEKNVKIVKQYIINKNLNFTKSKILNNYIASYEEEIDYNLFNNTEINDINLLANYLELIIPKDDRKVNGTFFTPTYIVDFIINEMNPTVKDKCLDPSCGGAFLIGLTKYYKEKYNKKTVAENIFGSDILDYNVRRAKLILSIYSLQNNEILEEKDFNIYHQDSLKAKWKNKFQIIVGNPPYVKYQNLSDENRADLIHNWKSIKNWTFNLYFAFFELGHNILTSNGKLGYITPNNYFTSLAGL